MGATSSEATDPITAHLTERVSSPAPSRADAVQNRARLLEAALVVLRRDQSASLSAIAREAGVGIGTLYRHFPTREDLLIAVDRNELDALVRAADDLLGSVSPAEALRGWLELLALTMRTKAGFSEVLDATGLHDRMVDESYGPILAALGALLAANQAVGDVRADVDADDVLLMVGFLWRAAPDAAGQARAQRLLALALDALRP